MPRVPASSDTKLITSITPNLESPLRSPANALVLLHGLGDSEEPFHRLGQQLQLPWTCVLAVRGPNPLPFGLEGFHWGDDIKMNTTSAGADLNPLDSDAGFKISLAAIRKELIVDTLVHKCGFEPRNIILWGFGQGGMLALQVAAEVGKQYKEMTELGGIISIGGQLPHDVAYVSGKSKEQARTPVLVAGGTSQTAITEEQVERIKRVFRFVEKVRWRRSGDGMPRNRDEMLPIMQFLSRRLKAGPPKDTAEIIL